MGRRVLVSAVLAYLILDFANPLVPGAVSFVAGELELVEGAKTRAPDTPAPVIAAPPRADVAPPSRSREPRPARAGASLHAPPRRTARSQPSPSSGGAPASPDDH